MVLLYEIYSLTFKTRNMKKFLPVVIAATLLADYNFNLANYHKKQTISNESIKSKDDRINVIEFKVNQQPVSTSGWTISRFIFTKDPSHQWLNITSNMHDDKRTINVNLDGSFPGVYFFSESKKTGERSHGSFFPDYIDDMTSDFSFTKGLFSITEVDTVKKLINGEFSGTVQNWKGETFEITDGKIINGVLSAGMGTY